MTDMDSESRQSRFSGFKLLLVALFVCGLVARIAPLFNEGGRLLQQYPTEDGYLMLTIARNIALGNGMSTADGTVATNGTQPLINLLYAVGFWFSSGDKVAGVLFAQVCQVLFSAVAAFALFRLGRRMLEQHSRGFEISALAAGAWYATLLSTTHGMNCLETGGYALGLVLFACLFAGKSGDPLAPWSFARSLRLGLALGVVFWIRIDAVFLILGACVTRAAFCEGLRFRISARNFGSAVIVGLTSIVVASPWLIYNKLGFGSVMPISGTAQSWAASFGQNLTQAIANLAEYAMVVVPIPQPLEKQPLVNLGCALIVVGAIAVAFRLSRHSKSIAIRSWLPVVGIFGSGLFIYYGMLFGAPHFVGRYLYPLSPFLALLASGVALTVWDRFNLQRSQVAGLGASLVLLVLVVYPNVRQYGKGERHQHFQVVEWIEDNVPESDWVGAVQTGTVGFFHDRTLNLDGKVNPEALVAAREQRIPQYIIEKNLRYIADWKGIASWMDDYEIIASNFDLVAHDVELNLAVLKRKESLAANR